MARIPESNPFADKTPPDSAGQTLYNPKSKIIVIDWLSKKRREAKRKETDEQKLRASLCEKLALYEAAQKTPPTDTSDDDHTELMVNGKKVRVSKTQIDLADA